MNSLPPSTTKRPHKGWVQIERYFPTRCILAGRCSALYYRARRWWTILRGHTGRTWRVARPAATYRLVE